MCSTWRAISRARPSCCCISVSTAGTSTCAWTSTVGCRGMGATRSTAVPVEANPHAPPGIPPPPHAVQGAPSCRACTRSRPGSPRRRSQHPGATGVARAPSSEPLAVTHDCGPVLTAGGGVRIQTYRPGHHLESRRAGLAQRERATVRVLSVNSRRLLPTATKSAPASSVKLSAVTDASWSLLPPSAD